MSDVILRIFFRSCDAKRTELDDVNSNVNFDGEKLRMKCCVEATLVRDE